MGEAIVLLFDADNTSDVNFGEFLIIMRYVIKARDDGNLVERLMPCGGAENEDSDEEDEFVPDAADFSLSAKKKNQSIHLAEQKVSEIHGTFGDDDDDEEYPTGLEERCGDVFVDEDDDR